MSKPKPGEEFDTLQAPTPKGKMPLVDKKAAPKVSTKMPVCYAQHHVAHSRLCDPARESLRASMPCLIHCLAVELA